MSGPDYFFLSFPVSPLPGSGIRSRTVVSGRLRVSSSGINLPVFASLPPILVLGFLLDMLDSSKLK